MKPKLKKPKPLSESKIQETVVAYARDQGFTAIKQFKLPGYGSSGWPDYLFIKGSPGCCAIVFFIEFKAPGEPMTVLQETRAKQICEQVPVYMCDDKAKGCAIIDDENYGKAPNAARRN